MYLRSVKLKNFRHHVDTDIHFRDGITAFVGPNGSGKSTIFEAITFSIYGSPALRTKAKQAISTLSAADDFQIELTFVSNGEEFQILRSTQNAKLLKQGKIVSQGSQNVTDYLTNLFRLNLEQFTSAFYTEQKKLEFLSTQRSRIERENFILDILGYSVVDRFIEEIRKQKKEIKSLLTGQTEIDETLIKQSINDIERELCELNQKKEFTSAQLESVKKELASIATKFDLYAKKRSEYEKLQLRLQALQESMSDLPEIPSPAELESLETRIKTLEQQLISTESKIEEEFRLASDEKNKVEAEIQAQRSFCQQLDKEVKIFCDIIETLKDGVASCPTCGQRLSDPNLARDHLGQKLLNLRHQKTQIELQLEKLTGKSEDLSAKIANLSKQRASLSNIRAEILNLEKKKASIVQRINEAHELTRKREQIESEVSQISEQLEAIKSDADHFRSLEVKRKGLENQEKLLLAELASVQTSILEKSSALEKYQRDLQNARQQNLKREALIERHLHLELSDKLMTEFRLRISAKVRPHLSELASNYLTRLTNGKITAIELDKSFDFTALCGQEEVPLLSGGEEDVVSLSLRMALSEMILAKSGISFEIMILDEIFGHLDYDRRTELLQLLSNLKNSFRQIFVISHIEDVQNFADNVVLFDYDMSTGVVKTISE